MHSPEQHWPELEQLSPRVVQLLVPLHTPDTQLLLQHSRFAVHAFPSPVQRVLLQWPVASQPRAQQSTAAVHVEPSPLHSPGMLQRFLPSTSTSQRPEQHWVSVAHDSLVGRHAVAGTLQLPSLQLPEQQSVPTVQGWW
jgi:hypothetical protein